MDLKSFVKTAVTDIVSAVEEVEEDLKREVCLSRKDNECIDFDIAVTVEDNESAGAGIKIFQVVSAGIANENKNSTTSRISFSLYVNSQTKKDQEEYRSLIKKKNNSS